MVLDKEQIPSNFFFFLLLDAARKFFKISFLFCFVNSKDPRASSAMKF